MRAADGYRIGPDLRRCFASVSWLYRDSVIACDRVSTGLLGLQGIKRRQMPHRATVGQFISNLFARTTIGLAMMLPYQWRVPLFGWIMSRVVSPFAGYHRRIRENLAHVLPDMPESDIRKLCRSVPDNSGRSLIEIYSGELFKKRASAVEIEGSGLAAMEEARDAGRPVVLVTGHFGNYDAPRAALISRGFNVGALYRPMSNRFFNAHYEQSIAKIGTPIFPRGRKGLSQMIRFLRGGGVLGFFIDNHVSSGSLIDFFGQPAPTSLSAAEMALKYDALILSVYGVRLENGLDFKIVINAPIDHSTPEQMTRELSQELEEMVRQHMDQWFWIHRRWKPEHQKRRAAAKMRP